MEDKRLMKIKDLMAYLSMGKKSARTFGREAGALVKYGNLYLYDKEKIDEHITRIYGG